MQLQALVLGALAAASLAAASGASPAGVDGMQRMRRHHSKAANKHHKHHHHSTHKTQHKSGSKSKSASGTTNAAAAGQVKAQVASASSSDSGNGSGSGNDAADNATNDNTSQSGSKLGIATADYSINMNKFATNGKVSWMYDWQATPNSEDPSSGLKKVPEGVCYFPMLWSTHSDDAGDGSQRFEGWKKYISGASADAAILQKCPDGSPRKIMMYNEVDLSSQGDMSVGEACSVARQYVVPLKKSHGVEIIGPSSIEGMDWYKQFRSQCKDVFDAIDYDAVHDYETSAQSTINKFSAWHAEFGKPLVISEVGAYDYSGGSDNGPPSSGDAWNYLQGVTEWAMKTDYVKMISPYAVLTHTNIGSVNALATPDGEPTSMWDMVLKTVNA